MKAATLLLAVTTLLSAVGCGPVDAPEAEADLGQRESELYNCDTLKYPCPNGSFIRCPSGTQSCGMYTTCSLDCDGLEVRCDFADLCPLM
ncbi:hypothetical protein [Corallococcus macrosporus]|uniref:Lipoprotein n=2 Tax=Myxococcaceae TaxID=31 RepID=A0A250JZZ1_9BACT|nr:hypothetical protein [Corallococcus macrosporus]AEI68541.1 hypothetical protein LILAB_33300 [Corallococcus macrosporus]ATB49313.1 hypothetical protein MYMAC_004956 [Corallococcus macrosporus DSM 14697]